MPTFIKTGLWETSTTAQVPKGWLNLTKLIKDTSGEAFKLDKGTYTGNASDLKSLIDTKADLVDGRVPKAQSQPSTMVIDNSTYVITFTDATGAVQTIDLPLESLFKDANYDAPTKSLIITLQDGTTRTIPLTDLVDLPEIVLSTTNPSVTPTTGQKVYFNTSLGKVWFNVSGVWVFGGNLISDSEKANLSTAYNHSQATGNPHNTKVEELNDVSGDATSIIDADVILKKESGGLWRKITWSNIKAGLKTYFDSIYTTSSAVASQITTALVGYATQSFVNTGLATKQDKLQDITGNIGVGKTDTSATEKLDVNGNIKASSFIRSGGTSTQFSMADGSVDTYGTTAGTVAEGNHTHTFASITSKPTSLLGYGITDGIKLDDTLQNTNVFGGRNLYINTIDNVLAGANKKYWVTVTKHKKIYNSVNYPKAINSGNITLPQWEDSPVIATYDGNQLFNNNYEDTITCGSDEYLKVALDFSADKTAYFNGYPYGTYYLSYYYTSTPDKAEVRCYNGFPAHTVGYKTEVFTDFINTNSSSAYVQQYTDDSNYERRNIEFIIYGHPSHPTSLTQIEWKLRRPEFNKHSSFVSNFTTNKLYQTLKLGDQTTDKVIINPNGTITADTVGIGTTSPSEKLEVNGNVKATQIKDENGTLKSQRTITITGNTTLSETHNGAVLNVTNTCNITIPTGLDANFQCVIFAKGSIIVTFVNGGVTVYAPSGLLLKTDKMASLISTSANNFNLTGELATS